MLIHLNATALFFSSTALALLVGNIAQLGSGMTICVAAGSTDPPCLGDPVPSILDYTGPSVRPREFEYDGDGGLVPYKAR